MTSEISGSHPLQPPVLPETDFHVSHEEIAEYIKIKEDMELLKLVLSAAEGYLGMRDGRESFSLWLQEHQLNSSYSGSALSAMAKLSEEKEKVMEALKDSRKSLETLRQGLFDLEQKKAHTNDPQETERLSLQIKSTYGEIQTTFNLTKNLEALHTLLNELSVIHGERPESFSVKGPPNWQEFLTQLEKKIY